MAHVEDLKRQNVGHKAWFPCVRPLRKNLVPLSRPSPSSLILPAFTSFGILIKGSRVGLAPTRRDLSLITSLLSVTSVIRFREQFVVIKSTKLLQRVGFVLNY